MKQLNTRFLTILTTLAFLGFTVSALAAKPDCDDPNSTHPKCNPDSGGGGSNGGGAKPLCVTFDDSASNNFRSDEWPYYPDYCDGFDGVSTSIDKFRFGLNVGLNDPVRNFFLNLSSNCVPGSTCTPPVGEKRAWNVFVTSPEGAQYLTMKKDDSKFVNFSLDFFDAQDRQWRIKFNPSECPSVTSTDTATVTKLEDDPDTWVFEAAAGAVACLYFREGPRKNHTFNGLYYLPFKIMATTQ